MIFNTEIEVIVKGFETYIIYLRRELANKQRGIDSLSKELNDVKFQLKEKTEEASHLFHCIEKDVTKLEKKVPKKYK